jgi:aspartate aminotransferase-like enzyme
MGNFAPIDIIITITALELVLKKRGIINSVGAGVEAAKMELDKINES